jgi:cytochrome P450
MYIQASVSVHQLAANHSPTNFASPEEFVPDRWFEDPPSAFKSDKQNAMNPFSVGPRNYVGQVRSPSFR